jgi:methylthioribose-1-phosphate isomerase
MNMSPLPHPEPLSGTSYSACELSLDNTEVYLLEQRRLPAVEEYVTLRTAAQVADGIRDMIVRGAPAIGITAAYGMVLAAREACAKNAKNPDLSEATERLRASRPTAVNLFWAIERCLDVAKNSPASELVDRLAHEARLIHRDDVAACRRMGELGAARIPEGATVLTHCNAGALATGGYGTALGVIRAAHEAGKRIRVLADETRPYLQGARLTSWELHRDGIPVEVLADSSAGFHMAQGKVDCVVVGSDRIAKNGDVANKIGTYTVSVLAKEHGIPFYVAAPWSTVDLECPNGAAIPIEERGREEMSGLGGVQLLPDGVGVRNPAFDVTPAANVRAIFTERGVVDPVAEATLERLAKTA